MASNLPMIRKAFLATRNVSSSSFLLTERFEKDSGDTLFYIIDSQSNKSAKNLQKYLQSDLVKSFLSTSSYNILDLESSLHFVNKKMLASHDANSFEGVNSLIGLLQDTTLHLAMTGEIEGYLLRKGKINSLTEGLLDADEGTGFYNITSGQLALSDLVVIGNKNIFNRLSLDRIRRTLNQYSPKEAIKDFYQILRKTKDYECNAVIFQAVSPLIAEKTNESLPDLLYLDEIVESRLSKAYKKSVPYIKQGWSGLSQITSSTFHKTRDLAASSSRNIKDKYSPGAKQLINRTNSRAIESVGKIKSNLKNRKSVKIKPYNKVSPNGQPLWLDNTTKVLTSIFAKKHRRYLYLALALILVFTAYLKIKANNQNREAVKKQNDATFSYDKAVDTFNLAKEDIGLGRSDGMDRLSEALILATTAKESNATKDKATILYKDIQTKIDEITKTHRVTDTKPIFSFKYDIVTSALSGSIIYGVSSDGKVYASDSRERNPKLVAAISDTLGKPIASTYSESMNLILVLTDTAHIWGFDEQTQSGTEMIIDNGDAWERASSLAAYSTYLYLLDSENGKIWRHTRTGDKFTAGKSYAGSKNTDAKGGISIAIDGAIFVLKPDGSITKFSHSIPDTSFVLQAAPKPDDSLAGAKEIYTDADSQHIFISDSVKNRVVRYAKDGQYINQYILDQIPINHLLFNPRIQKLWLISGKDVYEVDL